MNYACPCCSYLTLSEDPPGTFEICPVCGWEDDDVQFRDPQYSGGANVICLSKARENFHLIGAIDEKLLDMVRKPFTEEIPN
jgi:hypothetical protein